MSVYFTDTGTGFGPVASVVNAGVVPEPRCLLVIVLLSVCYHYYHYHNILSLYFLDIYFDVMPLRSQHLIHFLLVHLGAPAGGLGHLSMYVCMYVCMYIYIYVCIQISLSLYIYIITCNTIQYTVL